jgi:hypothetical protein
MVDTFPQLRDPVACFEMSRRARAERPARRRRFQDRTDRGGPGPPLEERVDPE